MRAPPLGAGRSAIFWLYDDSQPETEGTNERSSLGTDEMPAAARRVVLEVLRSASRDAFQVAFSFAARPPVSTMIKPAITNTKPLLHDNK